MRRALLLLLSAIAGGAAAQPRTPSAAAPAAKPGTSAGDTTTINNTNRILGSHNSNAPVDVDADRIEVQDQADRAVFAGNVRARQGDMTLTAARVTVAYTRAAGANPQIQRMDATGGVVVTQPNQRASSSYAIYDLDRRLVTMVGNVVLNKNGNVVRGGRAVLDLNTNHATVDGSGVGGGATTAAPGGRVSGRFTVPQKSQNDKGGIASAPATKP